MEQLFDLSIGFVQTHFCELKDEGFTLHLRLKNHFQHPLHFPLLYKEMYHLGIRPTEKVASLGNGAQVHVDGKRPVNELLLIDQQWQSGPINRLHLQLAEGAVIGNLNSSLDEFKMQLKEGNGQVGEEVSNDLCLAPDVVVEEDELFWWGLRHRQLYKYYKFLYFSCRFQQKQVISDDNLQSLQEQLNFHQKPTNYQ